MRVPLKELLFAISRALDFVEEELLGVTSNHGKRTAYLAGSICAALGMSEEDVFDMASCAVLHDNALTAYMLEAGPGDIARLEGFQSHCVKGEENAQAFPFAGNAQGIVLHHHENWNGSGFHKLVGEQIPPRAAVLRLADNLDLNLRLGQPRPSLLEEVNDHLLRYSGSLYWPRAVETLQGVLSDEFFAKMSDERIEASLSAAMPALPMDLNAGQMLKICGLFAFIIDAKSPFTRNHSSGLAQLVRRLAPVCGIVDKHLDRLIIAAYLHDIGKLSTPRCILEKPGPLTDDEFVVMRGHVAMTKELLSPVHGLEEITYWAAHHHEKLNGRGYPDGLAADELDFECRLLTCCDIYQALTENRPYRAGMGHEQAIGILRGMVAKGEVDAPLVDLMNDALASPAAQA